MHAGEPGRVSAVHRVRRSNLSRGRTALRVSPRAVLSTFTNCRTMPHGFTASMSSSGAAVTTGSARPTMASSSRTASSSTGVSTTSLPNQSTLISQVAYGQPVLRFKENDVSLYFQDDWRVKDNLTLNLGLRWEYYQQAGNILHDESVAQQTGPNHLWDQSLPLSLTTVPKLPNQYKNYGPVIGFAYTPRYPAVVVWRGQDRHSRRLPYRVRFRLLQSRLQHRRLRSLYQPRHHRQRGRNGGAPLPNIPTLTGASIATALFPQVAKENPGSATELQFGKNFRNPYSEQWNFGIQRQITNHVGTRNSLRRQPRRRRISRRLMAIPTLHLWCSTDSRNSFPQV